MKYHVTFDTSHTLSFEVLDHPAALEWFNIMQKENSEQKVFRSVFPNTIHPVFYFNSIKYNYEKIKEFGLDPEFNLNKNFTTYNQKDFLNLYQNINLIFKKVCQITKNEIQIPQQMRQYQWIEVARPRLVIRLCPNFDIHSLDVLERRDNPSLFNENGLNQMHYITSNYKICYYKTALTSAEAQEYMTARRSQILKFVDKYSIDCVPGDLHHYNFVPPVVAHCINEDDFTEDELRQMFMSYENVKIEFEE